MLDIHIHTLKQGCGGLTLRRCSAIAGVPTPVLAAEGHWFRARLHRIQGETCVNQIDRTVSPGAAVGEQISTVRLRRSEHRDYLASAVSVPARMSIGSAKIYADTIVLIGWGR
ncbi:hypothetical protein D3C81_1962530 [compost metagenome]